MAGTDFIKAPSKKSLLAMLKKASDITPKFLARFMDGVVFKNELKGFSAGGAVDHGALSGLAPDDDHSQYLLASSATSRANFSTKWTDLTDNGATTIHKHDHGGQDGLGDDDHTQYVLANGTRNITGDFTFEGDNVVTFEGGTVYFDGLIETSGGINTDEINDNGAGFVTFPAVVVEEYFQFDNSILGALSTATNTSYGLTDVDFTILCDATSNNVTINLPSASTYPGIIYNIKAINTDNTVTVSPDGSEEIDGSNSDIVLSLMESITIQSDGSNWWII